MPVAFHMEVTDNDKVSDSDKVLLVSQKVMLTNRTFELKNVHLCYHHTVYISTLKHR